MMFEPTVSAIAAEVAADATVVPFTVTIALASVTVGVNVVVVAVSAMLDDYEVVLELVVSPDATAEEAGVTIEKRDRSDLDRAIASNPSADTSRGLENLGARSTCHLAAFERVVADDTSAGTGSGSMGPNVGQGQGQGMGMGMGRGSGPGTGMGAMR